MKTSITFNPPSQLPDADQDVLASILREDGSIDVWEAHCVDGVWWTSNSTLITRPVVSWADKPAGVDLRSSSAKGGSMNTSTRLRNLADRMGLDGFAEELREIAGELEAKAAPAVPQGIPAQEVIDAIEAWKSAWLKVPPFADRVNKATREAITISHNSLFLLLQSAQQAQRMPAGCTTPTGCGPHGCHGACIAATPSAPSQPAVPQGVIYEKADSLYKRGYTDRQTGKDYDPRGCDEWQEVVDWLTPAAPVQEPAVPQGLEPAGFLLHWPAPGGSREIIWSDSRISGDAIGCPVTPVFMLAATPAAPSQPAVPQGEPVAWRVSSKDDLELGFWLDEEGPGDDDMGLHYEPLYTAAPPQEPVTLTEDEIDANTVWFDPDPHDNVHCDVHATVNKCIAALREKQGGA